MFARGVWGGGEHGGPVIRMATVRDGTSNTILLGELLPEESEFQRYNDGKGWVGGNYVAQGQTIQPINWHIDPVPADTPWPSPWACSSCDAITNPSGDPNHCMWNWAVTWGFKSNHPGGVNFAMADGSVHFISESIDHKLYQCLGCRHDGQPVTLP